MNSVRSIRPISRRASASRLRRGYPGYPHSMLTVYADAINRDLLVSFELKCNQAIMVAPAEPSCFDRAGPDRPLFRSQ